MEADLRRLPAGGEPDPVARLASAARALVRDQRERVRLLRGSSPLVDALEGAVAALEGELPWGYEYGSIERAQEARSA